MPTTKETTYKEGDMVRIIRYFGYKEGDSEPKKIIEVKVYSDKFTMYKLEGKEESWWAEECLKPTEEIEAVIKVDNSDLRKMKRLIECTKYSLAKAIRNAIRLGELVDEIHVAEKYFMPQYGCMNIIRETRSVLESFQDYSSSLEKRMRTLARGRKNIASALEYRRLVDDIKERTEDDARSIILFKGANRNGTAPGIGQTIEDAEDVLDFVMREVI